MQNNFTRNAKEAMDQAVEASKMLNHGYTGTAHVIIGLLSVDGVARQVLEENGITAERMIGITRQLVDPGILVLRSTIPITPRVKAALQNAGAIAEHLQAEAIGTEHILLALIEDRESVGTKLLNSLGANIQKIYLDIYAALGINANDARNDFRARHGGQGSSRGRTPFLDKFARDLTEAASQGKLDPVVGREKEITRVVEILSRRTKNNPCLTGEPGVGKTAIAEGLAELIVKGRVPSTVQGKRVMMLDMSGIVAGTKYRGEFEERIKGVINEASANKDVLLFIDELHTIIGAGGAEGSLDASNILKPVLARGEIQIIGATTSEEYRKYVEKDAALERRFQPVLIEEPTEEQSVEILRGLRDKYEAHHKVHITDEALEAAVKLSARYISDRFLPDKAIDVMDEACAHVRLSEYKGTPEVAKLESEVTKLEEEKLQAIKNEDFEEAGEAKKKQAEVNAKLEKLKVSEADKAESSGLTVDENAVADVVANWTKIPVTKIVQGESERLRNLESELHERVIGQDEAVTAVAKAIRRSRVGLNDPSKPIGSFLFLGPTGVGKTELSKALAESMFGSEDAMIRVDMSEYMEKHSVSKMIGSPPGYVGFDEGGQLSDRVRKNPYCVLLFDEIEKAHPDVFNVLLQVLDDGMITDSQGRTVNFKNTVIIMTSNAGAREIISPKKLGFATSDDKDADYKRMKDNVMGEVKRIFKPEFLNRIDEVLVFHQLTEEDLAKIVRILTDKVAKRVNDEMEIKLTFTDEAIAHLAKAGKDTNYGARPLKRKIQEEVEDLLADKVLGGEVVNGSEVTVGVDEDKIVIKAV